MNIPEIRLIRDKANAALDAVFAEYGWQRAKPLSEGDVRAVIEAYEQVREPQEGSRP